MGEGEDVPGELPPSANHTPKINHRSKLKGYVHAPIIRRGDNLFANVRKLMVYSVYYHLLFSFLTRRLYSLIRRENYERGMSPDSMDETRVRIDVTDTTDTEVDDDYKRKRQYLGISYFTQYFIFIHRWMSD